MTVTEAPPSGVGGGGQWPSGSGSVQAALADGPSIRVLGRLKVAGDHDAPLTGRARQLFCWLVMHANESIPQATLVARLWPADSPARPERRLASLAANLDGRLPDGAKLLREGGGLQLSVDPMAIDATRFLLAVDDQASDVASRAAQLTEALAMWRGTPYTAVSDSLDALPAIERLGQARLDAFEELAACRLQLSPRSDHETLADLQALVAAHPERPNARVLLVSGLQRAGRRAEALRILDEVRSEGLIAERTIRDLESSILMGWSAAG